MVGDIKEAVTRRVRGERLDGLAGRGFEEIGVEAVDVTNLLGVDRLVLWIDELVHGAEFAAAGLRERLDDGLQGASFARVRVEEAATSGLDTVRVVSGRRVRGGEPEEGERLLLRDE